MNLTDEISKLGLTSEQYEEWRYQSQTVVSETWEYQQ